MSINNYKEKIIVSLNEIDEIAIEELIAEFIKIINNSGNIIFAGNGGSYANSSHIAGDFQNCFAQLKASFIAIGDNFCSVSAVSNDLDYDKAISLLTLPLIKEGIDNIVILFSGSGNSDNVIQLAQDITMLDKEKYNIKTVSVSAYGGGKLPKFCDKSFIFSIKDMEVAEDLQLIIFHHIKQQLLKRLPIVRDVSTKYLNRTNNQEK